MKRILTTAAAVAVLSVSSFGGAFAAQDEMTMVVDTVTRLLVELKIPTDNVDNLTIEQVREIVSIADSHEMGDGTRVQVLKIINE